MALNQEYFDAIHIDVVKKKYYNANKVEAVFSDIRRQAEALYAENESMKAQLAAMNGKKFEIGDAVLSAQAIYREIVDKARARAAEIIAQAERQRDEAEEEIRQRQESAVQRVETCYARIKEQHMACIEAINSEWQEFLCGLFPEDAEQSVPPAAEFDSGPEAEPMAAPDDLEDKIGAIAQELFSIGAEDED
ncbi:MAG: hypothetical protein DBX49_07140 [Clostridia bacterium]|nr:MAG: hypothetical protein DBX49_07140 [Clostridia bacterium]